MKDNELTRYGHYYDSRWMWAVPSIRPKDLSTEERNGKWMLWPTGEEAVAVWRTICKLTKQGKLGVQAKIDCCKGRELAGERLICVYTEDSDDLEDLQRVVDQLRESLDPRHRLIYKEDRMTSAGGYKSTTDRPVSKWYVRPHETEIHMVKGYVPPTPDEDMWPKSE